eukprot:g10274.t1
MTRKKFKRMLFEACPPHLLHTFEGKKTRLPPKTLTLLQRLTENHVSGIFAQMMRMKSDIAGGHIPSCLLRDRPTYPHTDISTDRPACYQHEEKCKKFAADCGVVVDWKDKFAPEPRAPAAGETLSAGQKLYNET